MSKIAGATITGRGHIKKNVPCQDKIFSTKNQDFSFIGLADGAGSCKHSDIGAELVVKELSKLLYKNFNKYYKLGYHGVSSRIISHLQVRLFVLAQNLRIAYKELSSTMLFVVKKDNRFIAGHLGDGVIGCLKENKLKVISSPDNGEYANSTIFVTASQAYKNLKLFKGELTNIEGFVLMSDGTEESLYNKKEQSLAEGVNQMFNWLATYKEKEVSSALKENLDKIIKLKTTDDCSIILMKTGS